MDLLMTSIRLTQGVDAINAIEQAKILDANDQLLTAAKECEISGWIKDATHTHWQLTDEGFLFADHVAREFIGALIDPDSE